MGTSSIHIDDSCPKGRGRPRDEEARQRILDGALELLEESGFANITTDAIAERAGASKATIYRWWPNKSAVLLEALREAVALELPFPDTGNLEEDIRIQLRNFTTLLTGPRGRSFAGFIGAAQSDPEIAESFRTVWIEPRRQQAKDVLRKHQQKGALSQDIDLGQMLDLLYGPFYFRLLAGHEPLCARFADLITDLALQGLLRNSVS